MNKRLKQYIIGFVLSILLTITAFFAVKQNLFEASTLFALIVILALAQFIVQLYFFLHVGHSTDQNFNFAFFSTIALIVIVIAASLWIMNNLDYRHTGADAEAYILEREGIKK